MYAVSNPASVFQNEYERFCTELRAALKGRISSEDDHFLKDGGDGRHKHATLQRVMRLAALSDRPEHHEVLSEIVRPLGASQPCLTAAFSAETESTGPADVAQRLYELTPCKSNWQRARESLLRQLATTRMSLNALATHRHWQ